MIAKEAVIARFRCIAHNCDNLIGPGTSDKPLIDVFHEQHENQYSLTGPY
jgi:hypothetical protein